MAERNRSERNKKSENRKDFSAIKYNHLS